MEPKRTAQILREAAATYRLVLKEKGKYVVASPPVTEDSPGVILRRALEKAEDLRKRA
jgi:hypothetical protein